MIISTPLALADHTTAHTIQQLQDKLKALQAQLAALQSAPNPSLGTTPTPSQDISVTLPIKKSPRVQTTEEKELIGKIHGFSKQIVQLKKQLRADTSGTSKATLKKVTKERRELLENLIKKDPVSALTSMLPATTVSDLPTEIKSDVEQPVKLSGKIEVLYIDDFKQPQNNRFEYFLKNGAKRLNFYPAAESPSLVSGATVQVQGYQIGNNVVAGLGEGTFQVLAEATPPSVGDQKTLVVLITFPDTGAVPFTPDQARNFVFNDQMQAFFKEASYGKVSLSGDVLGWYTLPRSAYYPGGGCNWPQFAGDFSYDEVYGLIKGNVDVRAYQRLILLVNGCGGGMGTVGKPSYIIGGITHDISISWDGVGEFFNSPMGFHPFKWSYLDFVMSHELGHNLGVVHANSWDCSPNILYGSCAHQEYGNIYDVMGVGYFSTHFNAAFKDAYKWLDPGSLLTIDKSGTYTLNPYEGTTGVRAAKIYQPVINNVPFYLEFRKGVGFDSGLNQQNTSVNQKGLFVNWLPKISFAPAPRLLDMTPGDRNLLGSFYNGWEDVALRGNNVFTDKGRGITIGPVLSLSTSSITFQVGVKTPICVSSQPAILAYPVYAQTVKGEKTFWSFSIQNMDSPSCAASNYQANVIGPAGWTLAMGNAQPISLAPETEPSYNNFELEVPSNAQSGIYNVLLRVTNLNTSKVTDLPITVDVLNIEPAFLQITSPNGGEKWIAGTTHPITWSAENFPVGSFINILWLDEFGQGEGEIIGLKIDAQGGSFSWQIPASFLPNRYKILIICDSTNPKGAQLCRDESDGPFDILDAFQTSPLAHWKLDEGQGTVISDSSGNGNNGTLTNGPLWSIGKSGKALQFDKIDDAAVINSLSFNNLSPMSVTAWINPKSLGENNRGRIIDKASGVAPTQGWGFFVTDGGTAGQRKLSFVIDYASTDFNRTTANALFNFNEWTHVAVTWDGSLNASNARIYLNGQETTYSKTQNASGSRVSDAAESLKIGNDKSFARTFDGMIDDVRIFNRALTPKEIQNVMGGIVPPQQNLTLAAPNGGEKWQLQSSHTILWKPYDPVGGINHASEVTAYLERLSSVGYTTVGKIIETGKASIHWQGEIDQYGNYPPAGDYYIRVVNNKTGETDRSDAPFSLVPVGTVTADIKIDGSDGPLAIASSSDHKVSWSSNADTCTIYNGTLSSEDPGYQISNLPPTGSLIMKLTVNTDYARKINLWCVATTKVEGNASDAVEISSTPQSFVTVKFPNGGESLEWSGQQTISWDSSADIVKFSVALYKNDAFLKWIVTDLPNTSWISSHSWEPSQVLSVSELGTDVFKIYIIAYKSSGGTVEDKSDTPFSIVQSGVAPIAHWKLDEGQGTVISDSSGNGNNGTLTNGPLWSIGKSGKALQFDKIDDAAVINSLSFNNLSPMSVTAWINPKSLGENNRGRIIDKASGVAPTQGWGFFVTDGGTAGQRKLSFVIDYASTDFNRTTANALFNFNEWTHVAVTWDGSLNASNARIYLNGQETTYSKTQNASGSRVSDAAESLKIGNDKSFARTFDGMIDDVRIFNRALTPKEIQQIAAMPTSLSPLRKELTASIITSLERIVKIMQKILGQVQ